MIKLLATYTNRFGEINESEYRKGLAKHVCFIELDALSLEKLSYYLVGFIHKQIWEQVNHFGACN
jgi:hypothetical protein